MSGPNIENLLLAFEQRTAKAIPADDPMAVRFAEALELTDRGFAAVTMVKRKAERVDADTGITVVEELNKHPDRERATAHPLFDELGSLTGDAGLLVQAEALLRKQIAGMVNEGSTKTLKDELAKPIEASAISDRVRAAVRFRRLIVQGLLALKDRNFELALNSASEAVDCAAAFGDARLNEALNLRGRIYSWLGNFSVAEPILRRTVEQARDRQNLVLEAHARYDLAVLHIDQMEHAQAEAELDGVLEMYKRADVSEGHRDRARQMRAVALIELGRLPEASALLEEILTEDKPRDYRRAISLRDRARIRLAEGRIDEAWRDQKEGADIVHGWGESDFAVLSLRQVAGELIVKGGRRGEIPRDVGADILARVAQEFAGKRSERPHEIKARLKAIEGYLLVSKDGEINLREAAAKAAKHEADKLRLVSAELAVRLNDVQHDLVLQAERTASENAAPRPGPLATEGTEVPLVVFMREPKPPAVRTDVEKVDVLARLATAIALVHKGGAAPCGWTPSDVVVRALNVPFIARLPTADDRASAARGPERDYVAPELMAESGQGDVSSDLYGLGVLLVVWMGGKPPANRGALLPLRRALFGVDLKTRNKDLKRLALELIAIDAKRRPPSAFAVAGRLEGISKEMNSRPA